MSQYSQMQLIAEHNNLSNDQLPDQLIWQSLIFKVLITICPIFEAAFQILVKKFATITFYFYIELIGISQYKQDILQ